MATVYMVDLTRDVCDAAAPPRAWTCACEVAGCTSDADVRNAWHAAVAAAREAHTHADSVGVYRRVRCGDGVDIVNKYFATRVQLEVYYRDMCNNSNSSNKDDDVCVGACASTATAAEAECMLQRLLVLLPPSSRTAATATADAQCGCILVVCASQHTDVVPWHVLDKAAAAATLLFCVVLVYNDSDADSNDYAHNTQQQQRQRQRQWHARWYEACVEHGVEYVAHTAAPQLVNRDAVAHAGLLAGALSGSARLLQLLNNTTWPVSLRQPRPRALTTAVTSSATSTPSPQQQQQHSDNNSTTTKAVTSTTWQSANVFLVIVANDAAVDDNNNNNAAAAHTATAAAAATVSRYFASSACDTLQPDMRFYTHDLSVQTSRQLNNNNNDDGSNDSCIGTTRHLQSSSSPSPLLLVNKYYVTCVQPRVVGAETLVRDGEQQQQEEDDVSSDSKHDVYPIAYIVWPLHSSTTHMHDDDKDDDAATTLLTTVLHCLRRRGVLDVVLIDTTRVAAASRAAHSPCAWRRLCAQQHVEVITLHAAKTDNNDNNNTSGDEDDCRATSDVNRLRETLHCVTWPVQLPRVPQQQQQREQRSDDKVLDLPANRLSVCAYSAHTTTPAAADEEEALLRHVFAHALPPLLRQQQQHECASTTATTRALQQQQLRACVACVLPSLYAHTHDSTLSPLSPSFVLHNRYFDAAVRVCCDDGGVCAQQQQQQQEQQQQQQGCCCRVCDESDAVLVVCTRAALHAAAALAAADTAASASRDVHHDNDGDANSTQRAHNLRAMLCALQRRLACNAEVHNNNNYDDDTAMLSRSITTTTTAPLGLVYCTDVCYDDDAATTAVLADVCRIVRSTHRDKRSRSSNDSDSDDDDDGPLFELVWAATTASAHNDHEAACVRDEGAARVREALTQHAWPHRRMHTSRRTAAKQTATTAVVTPQGADAEATTTTTTTAAAEEAEAEDVDAAAPPVHTCALPPTHLVDPDTLRSVAVPALQRLQRRQAMQQQQQEQEHSDGNDSDSDQQAVHEELLQWVQRMNRHGDRLPWRVRKQQAEQLALALDAAW